MSKHLHRYTVYNYLLKEREPITDFSRMQIFIEPRSHGCNPALYKALWIKTYPFCNWLVVEPTPLKNMLVKFLIVSPSGDENKNIWNHHLV